jgi:hypothetical protein
MRFYDWRTVLTTLNGIPIDGWAEGDDVFKATRLKEIAELVIGAGGSACASLSADKSGEVTIKLLKTSPTNAFLSKLAASEDSVATFIPVEVQQVDTYRGDKVITTLGFIKKPADMQGGAKAPDVEWTFVFPQMYTEMTDPLFAGQPTAIAEALG